MASTKELRLSVTIQLPDDMFDQAERIASAKAPIGELIAALEMSCGASNVDHVVDLVTPRVVGAKEALTEAVRTAKGNANGSGASVHPKGQPTLLPAA